MPSDLAPMQRLGYASPSVRAHGTRWSGGTALEVDDELAEETPVVLAYNLSPYAVMMATPGDLEDFAIGFTITEGIVPSLSDIGRIEVVRYSRGIELHIDVPIAHAASAGTRSRRLSGRTGCGICGTEDIERVLREVPVCVAGGTFAASAISAALRALTERQPLNDATGAVHAAGWARRDGSLSVVREDVGRHNALDKLVGALLRAGEDAADGFVVLTSRGSFELVQKAAILGVSLVATVSAPTALAVRVAEEAGITLAGFAREGRLTVYTRPERVVG